MYAYQTTTPTQATLSHAQHHTSINMQQTKPNNQRHTHYKSTAHKQHQLAHTTQPDIITVQETNQTTPRHQLYQSKHLFTLTELEWWLLTYIKLNLNTHNVEIQAVITNSNKHKNITEGRKIQSLYTTTRCYLTT